MSTTGNIKVLIRLKGGDEGLERSVLRSDGRSVFIENHQFQFDAVADEKTSNEELFRDVGLPAVQSTLSGYNSTVFAYGQSGSGKTFTITGDLDDKTGEIQPGRTRGMIPLALDALFGAIRKQQEAGVRITVKVSFLEIYQEAIKDLLCNDAGEQDLPVRQDSSKGTYVAGLRHEEIESASSGLAFLAMGTRNRHTGATALNEGSSRSHSVFAVQITQKHVLNGVTSIKRSCLSLVDLAGSERQSQTQAEGMRLQEASIINKSLSQLGLVIRSLSAGVKHIPYRDSKLTLLLRDSLGGNSKATLIATVNPAYLAETLSTLRFASRASCVKNHAIINEQAVAGNVSDLQREILRLKNELEEAKQHTASSDSYDSRCMSSALGQVQALMKENESLEAQVEHVTELDRRHLRMLQSAQFRLKLREAQPQEDVTSERVKQLEAEVEALRDQLENNPEVVFYATEAISLQRELERFEGARDDVGPLRELVADLAKKLQAGEMLGPAAPVVVLEEGDEGPEGPKTPLRSSPLVIMSPRVNAHRQQMALKEELSEAQRELASLTVTCSQLREEVAAQQDTLQLAAQQLELEREQVDALTEERQLLSKRLDEKYVVQAELSTLREEHAALVAKFEAAHVFWTERGEATEDVRKLRASLEKRQTEVKWLKREHQEMEAEKHEWITQMQQLKKKADLQFAQREAAELRVEALESEVMELRGENTRMQETCEKQRAEILEMTGHSNARQKIKHMEKIKHENGELNRQLAAADQQLRKNQKEATELRAMLSKYTSVEEEQKRHRQLQQLQADLDKLLAERAGIVQVLGSEFISERCQELREAEKSRKRELESLALENELLQKEVMLYKRKPLAVVN